MGFEHVKFRPIAASEGYDLLIIHNNNEKGPLIAHLRHIKRPKVLKWIMTFMNIYFTRTL